MQFNEAVLISMKKFRKGVFPIKTSELKEGGILYTPAYFDELEEELTGEAVEVEETEDEV